MNKSRVDASRTAPSPLKVTPDLVSSKIRDTEYHVFRGSRMTVCCLTLTNGFTVIGESSCVDPANFDVRKGQAAAREKAIDKIWELEAYLLRDQFHQVKTQTELHQLLSGMKGADDFQSPIRAGDSQWVRPSPQVRIPTGYIIRTNRFEEPRYLRYFGEPTPGHEEGGFCWTVDQHTASVFESTCLASFFVEENLVPAERTYTVIEAAPVAPPEEKQ